MINFDYLTPEAEHDIGTTGSAGLCSTIGNLPASASLLSGEPMGFTYTLTNTTDITGGGGLGVDSNTTYGSVRCAPRPDRERHPPKDQRTPLRAFNTAQSWRRRQRSLAAATPPKDAFRGPGINNWDISLTKNFKFGRKAAGCIQFRFETYNTFNHTQFGGANGTGTSVDTVARFDAAGNQMNARFGQYLWRATGAGCSSA